MWAAVRILEFVKSGKLSLGAIKFFMLDEADCLLEAGDADTVYALFGRLRTSAGGLLRPCRFILEITF